MSDADIKEMAFYVVMHKDFPNLDRSEAVELGKSVCKAIDESKGSVKQMAMTVLLLRKQAGSPFAKFTEAQIGKLIGASVSSFCPEYKDQVDALS